MCQKSSIDRVIKLEPLSAIQGPGKAPEMFCTDSAIILFFCCFWAFFKSNVRYVTQQNWLVSYKWVVVLLLYCCYCIVGLVTVHPDTYMYTMANLLAVMHEHRCCCTVHRCFIAAKNIKYVDRMNVSAFSAVRLLVRWQEGHPACKNEYWVLV